MTAVGLSPEIDCLGYHDHRRLTATARGYRAIAADLLRDSAPSEDDLTLICVALADAALAGDRELLEQIHAVCERLLLYLPPEPWARDWAGRLWSVDQLALSASALLEVEYRVAASAPCRRHRSR